MAGVSAAAQIDPKEGKQYMWDLKDPLPDEATQTQNLEFVKTKFPFLLRSVNANPELYARTPLVWDVVVR